MQQIRIGRLFRIRRFYSGARIGNAVLALSLLFALPLQARTRTVHFPPEHILWIAPHPDDESLIAPLLGQKCAVERASCTLLVLTRGENGDCKLSGGCPNLGLTRAFEMLAAGAALHAFVIQWTLPDVSTPELVWPSDTAAQIAQVIATQKPDVIYTFDPNHGSTCHPAHRYVGQLVLGIVHNIRLRLVETEVLHNPDVAFAPATSAATAIDARATWQWLTTDLQAHPSQFTPAEVAQIAGLPDDQRRVWLMDAGALAIAQYNFSCN